MTTTPDEFSIHDAETTDVGLDPSLREDDALIGQILAGRYRIETRLGRGTTGAVYRASHIKFGRRFAVKVLHAERTDDPKLVRRFEREAELGGSLKHPNVISVIDVGEAADGTRFMVMDLAIGIDLATVLQDESPLASSRVIHLLRGICEGLAHAHERGVIHRDLKPENIIIELDDHGREVPRIVDFGIAIARDEAEEPSSTSRLTTMGLVLGTPHYMAPEQATGSAMDHRIDLFALGVVAYEMVCGVLPFDGSGAEVARANLLLPTPPMATRAPGVAVDPLLEAVTDRLMAKEPAARPPSATAARELLDLIERDRAAAAALLGLPVEAAEVPAAPRGPKRLETVPDPVLLARRAAKPPPSWLTPSATPLPGRLAAATEGMEAATRPIPKPRLGPVFEATPPALMRPIGDSDAVAPARPAGRARIAIAAVAVIALVGLGGAWLATRSSGPAHQVAPRDAGAIATALAPADAAVVTAIPADAAVAPPPPADAAVVAVPRADAAVIAEARPAHADASVAVVVAPVMVDAAVAIAPPAVDAAVPAVAVTGAPSPADVANLYTDVGHALKLLTDHRGAAASEALWQRYRLIRLSDMLATAPKRAEATVQLTALRREVTAADAAP